MPSNDMADGNAIKTVLEMWISEQKSKTNHHGPKPLMTGAAVVVIISISRVRAVQVPDVRVLRS
jgi:hypothetical protein